MPAHPKNERTEKWSASTATRGGARVGRKRVEVNALLLDGVVPARERSSSRAFTIVEVVMAVIVFALALTTSLAAMQRAFLQFDTARNLEIAGNILQCEMEKERLFSWIRINDTTYLPVIDPSFARNPAIGGRFTLSRTVAAVASHSGQMVQVTLTTRWRSYDGRNISRSYTTNYTQGGLYGYLYAP